MARKADAGSRAKANAKARAKAEQDRLDKQVLEKLSTLVTGAFGLVAALAWNGAVQEFFKRVFGTQQTLPAMILYAGIVTIVAVAATTWIGTLAHRAG